MVSRSPALDALRDHILRSSSAFLRNVEWTPSVTCQTCAGIPSPGYDQCYNCANLAGRPGLVDELGLVIYAWRGSQAGHAMHAYKAQGATTYQLVSSLVTYAVAAHWQCIARHAGTLPDSWASVPSLAGRQGQHPMELIANRFMGTIPHVQLSPHPIPDQARSFNPAQFTAPRTTARHVLLLDDTWTSGGHLQSASAALKDAGVERVTGLVVARWLEPSWGPTKAFLASLTKSFDPAVCPFSGSRC